MIALDMRRIERRVPGLGTAIFASPVAGDMMLLARSDGAAAPNHRAFVNEIVAASLKAPEVGAGEIDAWTERARAIARVAVAEAAGCAPAYRRLAGSGLSGDERLYRALRATSAAALDGRGAAPRAGRTEELRSLGRELFFVYLAVSILLGTPVLGAILKALFPGSIGPDESLQLVSITFTTAPLTLGVAAGVYFYLATKERLWPPLMVVGWTAIAVISLLIADAVGQFDAQESPAQPPPQFHPFVAVIGDALWVYLSVYGPGLFACALLIGGYAGWKWHRLTVSG